jgi:hypothetical protein
MSNYLNRIKEIFTMPSMSDEEPAEEGRGLAGNQSARTVLAIVLVVVSAFIMSWIMA